MTKSEATETCIAAYTRALQILQDYPICFREESARVDAVARKLCKDFRSFVTEFNLRARFSVELIRRNHVVEEFRDKKELERERSRLRRSPREIPLDDERHDMLRRKQRERWLAKREAK